MRLSGTTWAKGHGTENDFVLLSDTGGDLDLTADQVRALCDRRAGIGADGVLRVVRDAGHWFMDYRNADGSAAQMCGNGIRVFVAYLEHAGLHRLAEGERLDVMTRSGLKSVRRLGPTLSEVPSKIACYAADLGPWRLVGGEIAAADGSDALVHVNGGDVAMAGLRLDIGNPHVVAALASTEALEALDLTSAPRVEPDPPEGTNVEIVVPDPSTTPELGRLTMRVHERGVGETRSCGTGAVAAALAVRVWGGHQAPDVWLVDVPGGRLRVTATRGDRVAGERVELSGPAVIVAEGVLGAPW